MRELAKFLIISGISLAAIGAIFYFFSTTTGIGKLPGDIHIKKDNFSFHFPIVSCILISVILTILLNLFFRK